MTNKFSIGPIDWDKWFKFTSPVDIIPAFEPCRDDCECETECEDETDLDTAIAEATAELAQCNRILAELLARLEGKQ